MLKVAVIGVGNMGRHHTRNYAKIKSVKLVGVCDLDSKLSKEIASLYSTKSYTSYKELIEKEKPDAVSIAVPTNFHYEVASYCLQNGISVLVEKPIARNRSDAKKLIKLAKQKKVLLTVGHIERFNPAVIRLKELVDKGELGDILSIVVKRVGLFPPQIKDVNVVTDIGVHDLDMVTDILGVLPNSVFASGSGALTNGRTDHAEIFLDYGKSGCFIQTNWLTPIKIRNLSITGTKGYAELNYINQQLTQYKSNYNLLPFTEFKEFIAKFGEPEKISYRIRKKEPLELELRHFIDCVTNNLKPKVSPEDGLRALLLAEAVNSSIKTKRPIKLNNFK